MKKIVLFTLLCFALLTTGLAQHVDSTTDHGPFAYLDFNNDLDFQKTKIKVFPNPASAFIKLSSSTNIEKIKIINMVGRTIKEFDVTQSGEKYNILEIPNGLYLVQLIDKKGKTITTKRLNKR